MAGWAAQSRLEPPLTSIEYALIAGLAAVVLAGAGPPVLRALQIPLGEIASALTPGSDTTCQGAFCVEPAAGAVPPHRRRP